MATIRPRLVWGAVHQTCSASEGALSAKESNVSQMSPDSESLTAVQRESLATRKHIMEEALVAKLGMSKPPPVSVPEYVLEGKAFGVFPVNSKYRQLAFNVSLSGSCPLPFFSLPDLSWSPRTYALASLRSLGKPREKGTTQSPVEPQDRLV